MRELAYDTETTGLYAHRGAEMFSYSTGDLDGRTLVQRLDGSKLRQLQGRRRLAKLWSDSGQVFIMHQAKFDLAMTEKALGRQLEEFKFHDTLLASKILQNHHHNHSLDHLAWELGKYERVDAKVKKLARQCGSFQKVPEKTMTAYQRSDAERTMFLYLFFLPKIRAVPEWLACYEMELALIWPTMRMEARGLMLHRERTRSMIDKLEQDVDVTRAKMYDAVGYHFNPDSPGELRRVLYTTRGLPILKLTAKGKKPSTDKHVLMELQQQFGDPVLDMILRQRAYSKGVSTLESYLKLATRDGIINPTINTCQAVTTRESCENPNLQNVQKTGVLLNPYPVPARDAFRPRPGYVNLHVDYAGIEMRLLIHYSDDTLMVRCLNTGDGDVHSLAAAVFYQDRFNSAEGAARKTLRGAAKNMNFAIPYGGGAANIARGLGLNPIAGAAAFRRYRKAFPKLVELTNTVSRWVRRDGFVTTVFGRRLYVPVAKAYMGTNYLIQGTAAGILKRAQIDVHRYNERATGGEVRLLLPIHDELVIEYPRKRMADVGGYLRDIRKLMIDYPMFKVPLDVEAEASTYSWEHKTEVRIPA